MFFSRFESTVLALAFLALAEAGPSSSCAELLADNPKLPPCVEIPKCGTGKPPAIVTIDHLSSGLPASEVAQTTQLCHDGEGDYLQVSFEIEQQYVSASINSKYTTCNSGVFYLDVMEAFISPPGSSLHCYSEIDLSMANVPFFSGIFNPNLSHEGIVGTPINCASSGIAHATNTSLLQAQAKWTSALRIPLSLLRCPAGCPEACSASQSNVWRANFYRIRVNDAAVMQTQKCTTALCDYLAWSPTNVSPPSFHEPLSFGFMVFV